jgi:hypothetical protein
MKAEDEISALLNRHTSVVPSASYRGIVSYNRDHLLSLL